MCTNAARARFEASNKTLVGVAAGAEHLVDKLDGLPFGGAMPPVTEATVVTVLAQCEAKMLRALEGGARAGAERETAGVRRGRRAPARDPRSWDPRPPGGRSRRRRDAAQLPPRALPGAGDDSGDEEGDDSGEEAGEESVLDRELVKANAEAVTERAVGARRGSSRRPRRRRRRPARSRVRRAEAKGRGSRETTTIH